MRILNVTFSFVFLLFQCIKLVGIFFFGGPSVRFYMQTHRFVIYLYIYRYVVCSITTVYDNGLYAFGISSNSC